MPSVFLPLDMKRNVASFSFGVAYALGYFDIAKKAMTSKISMEILLEDTCPNECYHEMLLLNYDGYWNIKSEFDNIKGCFQTQIACQSQIEQLITRISLLCDSQQINSTRTINLGLRVPISKDSDDYYHIVFPELEYTAATCALVVDNIIHRYVESVDRALSIRPWNHTNDTYFWAYEDNEDFTAVVHMNQNDGKIRFYRLLTCFRLNEKCDTNDISVEKCIWMDYKYTELLHREFQFCKNGVDQGGKRYKLDECLDFFNKC